MVFPINGSPTYTSWYIPSSSVSGSNIFVYGSDNTGEYQSDSIITPFDVADLSGVAVRILAGFENSRVSLVRVRSVRQPRHKKSIIFMVRQLTGPSI